MESTPLPPPIAELPEPTSLPLRSPPKRRPRLVRTFIEVGEICGMKRVTLRWEAASPLAIYDARAESHRLAATAEEMSARSTWTVYLTDVDRAPSFVEAKGAGVVILTFERDEAEAAKAIAVLEALAESRGSKPTRVAV